MCDLVILIVAITIATTTINCINNALPSAAHGGGMLGIYASVAQPVLMR